MTTSQWLRRICGAVAFATVLCGQERPTVLKLAPAHQTSGVLAAKTTQLLVTFDQDMDVTQHAVCGGGASFPKVSRTRWTDARTFALDVELSADHIYSMDLACPGSAGFRAKNGEMLRPTPWRFATRGETLPEGAAANAASKLFEVLRDHYSYRDRLGIDWNDLEHRHHDALVAATDGPAFALLVTEVLSTAQDPHIAVRWNDCSLPTYRRAVVSNFDQRGLQKTLPKLGRVGKTGFTARTDDGIGYLFLPSFAREQREDFEQALQALRGMLDCKGLVLDVRTNGGGDEMLARRLAAFFVQGDVVYAQHRVRDAKAADGFREVENRSLRGNNEPDVFQKPVAVLMGSLNMSSCEAFLLMMKQAPQAFLVGADSYGSSGNPQPHTLVPHLVVQIPSWQALRPDGSMIEGEGIAPHIHIDATPEQLRQDDPVLNEALLRLRGKR